MTLAHIFGALGGLGLFLFSLRSLLRVLQRSLSRRLRGLFARALAHPLRCLASGFLATILVQASSITVMGSMSLVGTTLITLEQGYFVMLGATLGTSIKIWFLTLDTLFYGPLLVGLSSLALLFVRRGAVRDLCEGVLAISLALWGMWLIGHGLNPLLQLPFFQDLIRFNPGHTLAEQAVGVTMGAFLAICVQSSSTVVAFTLVMAAQGALTFPQAACLVLGANVGTTFGPLLASLEYGPNLKRLALAHFLVKLFGALITLFFFPQFLNVWSALIPAHLNPASLISYRLAAIHTGFNLINVIWWSIFGGLILRLVGWLVPAQQEASSFTLAPVVRRILRRSPRRSYSEARRQLQHLTVCVKSLLDQGTALMLGEQTSEVRLESRILEQREFQSLKESTYELLIQASRDPEPGAVDLHEPLTRLADLEELYYQAWRLSEQLEHGLLRENFSLAGPLTAQIRAYQRCIDELWLVMLFPAESPRPQQSPTELSQALEEAFFQTLRDAPESSDLETAWTFDLVSNLRDVLLHLGRLAGQGIRIPESGDEQPSN